tara:strand:+ start:972 stop:2384 length:1413 start_codon:yes stop_codon:yes gene_type:complete
MPNIIEQKPKYDVLPVGQDIIFAVSNVDIVANQLKVKFVAQVRISSGQPPTASDLVATFKTTPNNKGVGIFDFSNVVENYVKADNMAFDAAKYKNTTASDVPFPIHLVDNYSRNTNNVRYLAIRFKIEYLGADATYPNVVSNASGNSVDTEDFLLFNGYLKETDVLEYGGAANQNFGWDWKANFNLDVSTQRFLTNAPFVQSANLEDYGTLAFLQPQINDIGDEITSIALGYVGSDGSLLASEIMDLTSANGAFNTYDGKTNKQILYFGCFPANLRAWSTTFQGLVSAGTIQGGKIVLYANNSGSRMTKEYTININCPESKGFEPIRLCWLNQYGVWDYFTFNKKSTRSISTKGSTYNQLAGTWNSSTYRADGFKGGKKSFRVNATEKIKMNTDFVSADYNTTFEELINSPEVYILDGFQTDNPNALLNTYVTPVRLTTSNFTRKTVANDKLIQYSFEVEKSKKLRTQSV